MKQYAAVFEKTSTGFSAYCPDVPGLASCGKSFEEARQMLHEALDFHLEGLLKNGDPIPEPSTRVLMVEAEIPEQQLAKSA